MLEYINCDDYVIKSNLDLKYYAPRWDYYKKVIEFLSEYNTFESALELGPYKFSIVKSKNVDVIDIESHIENSTIHDANKIPWPCNDKQYDLFIGLQVLEHLDNKEAVFKEIQRISKYAIISLPYRWRNSEPGHNDIDENVIFQWFKMHPTHTFIIKDKKIKKNKKKYDRIVCFYKFC